MRPVDENEADVGKFARFGGASGFSAVSLNLSPGAAYAARVGVPSSSCSSRLRVKPGSVSESHWVDKAVGEASLLGIPNAQGRLVDLGVRAFTGSGLDL